MTGRNPGVSPPDPVLPEEYGAPDEDEFAFEAGEYEVDEYEDEHRDDAFLDGQGFDLDDSLEPADELQGGGDFNLNE